MLETIGIKWVKGMSREEVIQLVENSKDGWGHIRSKCRNVEDKIQMMVWTSKVASAYLLRGGSPEKVQLWLSDMIPNLAQALLGMIPQDVLDKKVLV